MGVPSQLKPALWGAVGGAVALAIVGFTWGGWVTGGKADVLARQQVQAALVEVLTPICIDKFNKAMDAPARLVELKKITSSLGSRALRERKRLGKIRQGIRTVGSWTPAQPSFTSCDPHDDRDVFGFELRWSDAWPAPQFEFPTQMRELAERNVEQVRAACSQFMDAVLKSAGHERDHVPDNPMIAGMKQVQERTMRFTRQNMDASFALAQRARPGKGVKGDDGYPKSPRAAANGGLHHASAGAWPADGGCGSERSDERVTATWRSEAGEAPMRRQSSLSPHYSKARALAGLPQRPRSSGSGSQIPVDARTAAPCSSRDQWCDEPQASIPTRHDDSFWKNGRT